MTERHIESLRWLLPGWRFEVTKSGWLAFRAIPQGRWANTSDPWDYDHLCSETERALLAMADVYGISIRHDISPHTYVVLDAEPESWRWQEIEAEHDDKLTALLEAISRLKEATASKELSQ